jgi:hypothetical protein
MAPLCFAHLPPSPRRSPTFPAKTASFSPFPQVRTEVLGAGAGLEEAGGQKWTVERVLQAHKEGLNVKDAIEEGARRVLLRREMDKRLGDGKGKFNAKLLLDELPKVR